MTTRSHGRWGMTRRDLLRVGAGLLVGATPLPALAHRKTQPDRDLRLYNLHTAEQVNVVYWSRGEYVSEALDEINRHLRDFRTGDVSAIDPKLLDILFALRRRLESTGSYHVVSGYRSPRTNAMLAKNRNGVAKRSLHTRGMAIDVKLPGRNLRDVQHAARAMAAGGVGYYPSSGFVHLDVGRVRFW